MHEDYATRMTDAFIPDKSAKFSQNRDTLAYFSVLLVGCAGESEQLSGATLGVAGGGA